MEFLRSLSLTQIGLIFAALFLVIIIGVIITSNARQVETIDYRLTTATPFIDTGNVNVGVEPIALPTEQ